MTRYFGGKGADGTYHKIINQIPPHNFYVEPFFGGGSIFKHKLRAAKSLLVDKVPEVLVDYRGMVSQGVLTVTGCALDVLANRRHGVTDCSYTYMYLDPTYPWATRRSRHRYPHELTDDDHAELLDIANSYNNAMVSISTYDNKLYQQKLKGWRKIKFDVVTSGGTLAKETLYMNYDEPICLHDNRYQGDNYNSRQDIARRVKRTYERLMTWPSQERIRIINELLEQMPEEEKVFIGAQRDGYWYV